MDLMKRLLSIVLVGLFLLSGCTQYPPSGVPTNPSTSNVTVPGGTVTPPPVSISVHPELGQILVGSNNLTLYVFLKDEINKSNCYDACAALWPPLIVTGELTSSLPGTLGTILRADGSKQATYNGMPLYYFSNDTKSGDINGNGFKNVWFVAKPDMVTFPKVSLSAEQAMAIANASCSGLTGNYSEDKTTGAWQFELSLGCASKCTIYQNGTVKSQVNECQSNQTITAKFPVIKTLQAGVLGQILTNSKGLALYIFAQDSTNMSNCYGGCVTTWPPLILTSGYTIEGIELPGVVGTIVRSDGSLQVTYNGLPLYSYAYDSIPGQVMGDGVGGVWHVVKPDTTAFPLQVPTVPGGY